MTLKLAQLFSTSVNTPLKPPSTNKENQQSNGLQGRKISISNQPNTPGGYGPLSPTSTRGSGRRRDTSESFQFPSNQVSSPTSVFNRDEQRAASPPPSLIRRRTDLKDANKPPDREGDSEDKSTSSPFGSLKRHPTGPLSAGLGTPSSPWSNTPQSAGFSPMGSFGNFGLGQQTTPSEKRPNLGSGRSESRFKNVLNKDGSEDAGARTVERKSSMSSLSRVMENESWRPQQAQGFGSAPPDEAEEAYPSGSAALGADTDTSPLYARQGGLRGLGTPSRTESRDDYGFGAFGMTSDNAHAFGQGFMQQTPAHQRQIGGNEPMSPTDTNPYKSPEQHGIKHLAEDLDPDMSDMHNAQLPGLGGFGMEQAQQFGGLGGLGAFANRTGGFQDPASDRSQTSSAGANRGFPGLGGMGPLGGVSGAAAWPVSQGGIGTPSRQTAGLSNPFGSGIFSTGMGDMQSPGLSGFGGGSMLGSQGAIGGSRMASMFPAAMQEQMRPNEPDIGGDKGARQPFSGLGEYGRPGDGSATFGEPESAQLEQERSFDQQPGQFGAPGQHPPPIGQPAEQSQEQTRSQQPSAQGQAQPNSSASNQPPPPQQRTMVMPDRMRWIYRDPQGQTQGPWTGLEMHDWYKAGFFSPELLVKKYEDPDYEPLAQLIRRIGNSREPFLVPQIGIPHGPASNTGPTAWAGAGAGSAPPPSAGTAPTAPAGAQPPFASSFPSFGTTLTAEQQNALERRKQEEQYLMARQKEHLAQAQIAQRMQHHQMPSGVSQQHGLGTGQLHHHGSAQSLHSQPSIGSMTSPTAGPYQSSPSQGPQGQTPGFFDNSFRAQGQASGLGAVGAGIDNLGHIREEEIPGIMHRLNLGRAAPGQFGAPGQPFAGQQQMQSPSAGDQHSQQVQQMLHDRALLQQEQAQYDAAQQPSGEEQPMSNERLQQFQQLQGSLGNVDARFQPAMEKSAVAQSDEQSLAFQSDTGSLEQQRELSLTEQVQQAASAQQSPVQQHSGLPFPSTQSPLPAPAAQRTGRQSVADQLQTEQRDLSQTPSADTPSAALAPWAEKSNEATRGPSLKEIQEMEAKKAAEAEEMASTARRAALRKEMEAQAQVIAPAPGLPLTASWAAAGGSPVTPTSGSGSSAWAKAAQKSAAPATTKTMAQIQKEEETRKKKLAAATANAQATAMVSVPNPAGGKSYANLAGKVSSPAAAQSPVGDAWTTVGAGGKPKTPAAPPVPVPQRTMSSGVIPVAQPSATTAKKPPTRSATMSNPAAVNAQDEFRKWAIGELRPDLNKSISGKLPLHLNLNIHLTNYSQPTSSSPVSSSYRQTQIS